ncbi:phage tail spike protein [Bacillus licheniformis]|uniref:phage tail spike protein n=1 Tax=Bacillus licheniformis TaxID=1402 RepID=UPI001C6440D8|nr:phage tail spike protein [Bacillus licheniformis]MBW7632514.1 phage tail protein [Bacillus licheniformis]MDH3163878.1 phage tail spike protein [Bacillus licheniformis]MED4409672.1 phage tail spike protein [Bacillus licheniformis]
MPLLFQQVTRSFNLRKPKLSLAKANKKKIANLVDISNVNLTLRLGEINELSFAVPLKIEIDKQWVKNPHLKRLKLRRLVKLSAYNFKDEWFIIKTKQKTGADNDLVTFTCMSLGHQLSYRKVRRYEVTSYNMQKVTNDCFANTNWKAGYINPLFNEKFRSFDITSSTKLDFLFKICETFEAVPVFDTIEKKVHFYTEDEVSNYKGMRLKYGQYLDSIEDTEELEEVCTRLYVTGKDDLSINAANPTGQAYIEDFTYFLYPFERDKDRKVITHSYEMSDELCHAILDFNEFIDSQTETFSSLLSRQTEEEKKLSTLNAEKAKLDLEYKIILDKIAVATEAKDPTAELIKERKAKEIEIESKKKEIEEKEKLIKDIQDKITLLKGKLTLESHLNDELKEELAEFINEQEWANDNLYDETDLYEAGLEEMKKRNTPPINITMSIVNFFGILSEHQNWDRLSIGDIVRVQHDRLGIDVKTKVIEMTFDFEANKINLTVSNSKRVETVKEKMVKLVYTVSHINNDYAIRKIDWMNTAENFKIRNDRISAPVAAPTVASDGTAITHELNDNGSVDIVLKWEYPYSDEDKYNIDGFEVYLYSSESSDEYVFGSKMSHEEMVNVKYDKRSYKFTGLASNKYYTVGVRAYRRVDADIERTGIILSDIVQSKHITENPYLPSAIAEVKGRVNGLIQAVSEERPENPDVNTVWINPKTNKQELYDGEKWIEQTVSSADSLNGYSAEIASSPNTIAVRDETGTIDASITGSATQLGGYDASAYVLKSELPSSPQYATGEYIGDGKQSRSIGLNFIPNTVKIYSTSPTDSTLIIQNSLGGYSIENGEIGSYLKGGDKTYGSLNLNYFITGSDSNTRGNKLNVKYIWEAFKQN